MTIAEVISKVDALKPNTYTPEDKIGWLSNLDGRVKSQIIDAHVCNEPIFFYGYDENDMLYYGRTYMDCAEIDSRVIISTEDELEAGVFVDVKIIGTDDFDLVGEVIL